MTNSKPGKGWTVEQSAALYGIRDWGAGYFDLNEQGEVTVRAGFPGGEVSVSLMEIVSGIAQRGHA
ncbi:MAG: hypothetical protein GWN87_11135, partial [Desulfuromonadales bacterium]|nr:hypothetical protein [Desulfuromonadales bacterium]